MLDLTLRLFHSTLISYHIHAQVFFLIFVMGKGVRNTEYGLATLLADQGWFGIYQVVFKLTFTMVYMANLP